MAVGFMLGVVTVRQVDLDLYASDRGYFSLVLGEETLASGESLDEAKRKAAAALVKRDVKVAVPFRLRDGRRGVAERISLKSSGVLCTIGGERDEIKSERMAGVQATFKDETPDEVIARLLAIDESIRGLERERAEIDSEWALPLASRVRQAVAMAVEAKVAA